MAEKFFDIIPPKKINLLKEEPGSKKIFASKNTRIILRSPAKPGHSVEKEKLAARKSPNKRVSLILKFSAVFIIFLILVLVVGFVFHSFYSVEVKIWPKTEVFKAERTIIVDSNFQQSDFQQGQILGKIFEDQKDSSDQFFSTGKAIQENKAQGAIRIYNNYSTSAQTLVAKTRFVSTDGILFKSIKKEVIPGESIEKGKITAGYKDIEVEAAESGDQYNIGPTSFSIPGFAGTSKYTSFYGKSFAAMKGGFKGEVSQVIQQDLESARSVLSENLKNDGKSSILSGIPETFVVLNEAINQEIIEENFSAKAGEKLASFNLHMKISSKQIAFKKQDIEDFAKNIIVSNISEGKICRENNLRISYSLKEADFEKGRMVLAVIIEAEIYSIFDTEQLKKSISGKNVNELKIFLKDQPQIADAKIEAFPAQFKRMPDDIDKIKVKLYFND